MIVARQCNECAAASVLFISQFGAFYHCVDRIFSETTKNLDFGACVSQISAQRHTDWDIVQVHQDDSLTVERNDCGTNSSHQNLKSKYIKIHCRH
jgi:hypothetical protein